MHIEEHMAFEHDKNVMNRHPGSRFACAIEVEKWMNEMPVSLEFVEIHGGVAEETLTRPWFTRYSRVVEEDV